MLMPKIVRLTLVIYLILLIETVLVFLAFYGFIEGNVGEWWSCDPEKGSPDDNAYFETEIIFNRWYLGEAGEPSPWLLKVFFTVNFPSAIVAWGIVRLLETFAPPFQDLCPLGLSRGTYTYGLTLLISLFQWFFIGHLIRWLVRRFTTASKRITSGPQNT